MKKKSFFKALSLSVILSFFGSYSYSADLETVPQIDPLKYLGNWYRISANPLPFEGVCACARQQLSLNQNGKVDVYNSCNDQSPQGPLREIRGFATPDDASFSKLTVDFGLPRLGKYWIIAIGNNYEYAVVSDPTKYSLYIMSKTPELDPALYQEALAKAAQQTDTSKLVINEQLGCTYP